MTEYWELGESGLFTPSELLSPSDSAPSPSIEFPVFRFLMGNLSTQWSMNNWEAV